jgi:PAS domain S-box-containing protein
VTPAASAGGGDPTAGAESRDLDVVVVEDDPGERWLVSEIVRSRGHRVRAYDTAEDAWDACRASPPELIVLDLVLPGMDGLALCRRVRRAEGGGDPVILVVTGRKEPRVLEEVLAAGADDYVEKPVDVGLLSVRLAVAERDVARRRARRETQGALDVRSRELDAVIEKLDDAVFTIDVRAGTLVRLSRRAAELLGRTRDDFEGDPELWRTLLVPPAALERLRAGDDERRRSPLVHTFQAPAGGASDRWLEATLSPVPDSQGAPLRVAGVLRDITDRQRSAVELDARNREIATLFRVSELTMAGGRPDEVFGAILDEIARATGVPVVLLERFEPTGQTLRIVRAHGVELPPQGIVAPLHHTPSGAAVRERSPQVAENVGRRRPALPGELGGLDPVTWISFPLLLDGDVMGTLSLVDVGERPISPRLRRLGVGLANTLVTYLKRLDADEAVRSSEARYRTMARRLQQANQELESFAYSVSHDLRAPLRTMQGFAHTLLQNHGGQFDAEARGHVRRILESGRRAECLIADLLAYSRLSFEEMSLRGVALDGVVEEAVAQLQADLDDAGAELHIDPELPRVRGHRATLVQVVANLVSNAAKFVPPDRTPRVAIRARVEGGRVRVEVEDNGIGVPPDQRERIFGVFERLSAPSAPTDGTGIGLAVVRRGVERLGGRVGVAAGADTGSVFWFELPA